MHSNVRVAHSLQWVEAEPITIERAQSVRLMAEESKSWELVHDCGLRGRLKFGLGKHVQAQVDSKPKSKRSAGNDLYHPFGSTV